MPGLLRRRNCTHYWIIEPSDNGISRGRCKYCHKRQNFINDWELAVKTIHGANYIPLAGKNSRKSYSG